MKLWMPVSLALICVLALSFTPAAALKDPSAVYCTALGYSYVIGESETGQIGYCRMPDGGLVDSWAFLLGAEGEEYGYCARMGYEQRVVETKEACGKYLTGTCAVCVLPDGREVEVAELAALPLEESDCGDGVCGMPENHLTCPEDCPKSDMDGLCEQDADGVCDPDCSAGLDPDCEQAAEEVPGFCALAALLGLVFAFFRLCR